MHSLALSLGFKGERTYIQGADMLNATMQFITCLMPHARIEKLDFKINAMTSRVLFCHWWPNSTPQAPMGKTVATFTFLLDGAAHEGKLIEAEGCAEARRPYDESPVQRQCVYSSSPKSAVLTSMPKGFSPVEALVSMNKALHLKELSIPHGSQWVFCRWESPHWPPCDDLSGAVLTLEQTLGTRMTRSRIDLHAEQIGTIYFSALKTG